MISLWQWEMTQRTKICSKLFPKAVVIKIGNVSKAANYNLPANLMYFFPAIHAEKAKNHNEKAMSEPSDFRFQLLELS